MQWTPITREEQINEIKALSKQKPQVIFKHSTRCSISSVAKSRLERFPFNEISNIEFHFLDLIQHKNISNKIAEDFAVYHESPQVLLIKNEECTYTESHSGITVDELIEQLSL